MSAYALLNDIVCRFKQSKRPVPLKTSSQGRLSGGLPTPASGVSSMGKPAFQRTGSSNLDERLSGDPFSSLDPIARPIKAPMAQGRVSKSLDAGSLSDVCSPAVQYPREPIAIQEHSQGLVAEKAPQKTQSGEETAGRSKAAPEKGTAEKLSSLLDS